MWERGSVSDLGRRTLASLIVAGSLLLWLLPDHYHVATLNSQDIQTVPGRAGLYRFAIPPESGSLLRWNLQPLNMSFLFEDDTLLWLRTDLPGHVWTMPDAHGDVPPPTWMQESGWHAVGPQHVWFTPQPGINPQDSARTYRWEVHGPLQGWRLAAWCLTTLSLLGLALVPGPSTALYLSWIARGWLTCLAASVLLAWTMGMQVPDRIEEAESTRWLVTRVLAHAEDHGPGFGLVLAGAGALQTGLARLRRERRSRHELSLRAWFIRWSPLLFALLYLLSWWKLSAYGPGQRSFSDAAPYSTPLGTAIAWSDGASYVEGIWALLDTGTLDEYSQRRAINACLAAVRYGLAGYRPAGAQLIQLVLLGAAMAFAHNALARRFGSWTALAAWCCCWGYARFYLITALSEPLGLTLGAYGLGLLLRAAEHRSRYFALAGLFSLSLAQAARPGALFVLPALGCWIAWNSGRSFWQKSAWLAIAAATVLAGIGTLSLLNRIYGTPANDVGSNFAYTLAGLAMGKNWKEVRVHYDEELSRLPTEGAKARFLYAEAWEHFRRKPLTMVHEFRRGTSMFAVELFPSVITFAEHAATRSFRSLRRIVIGALMILVLVGCMRTMIRGNGLPGLWLWGAAGLLVSIPFVFLDGGWRIVAPVWPAITGWFATSLATRHRLVLWRPPPHSDRYMTAPLSSPALLHGGILIAVLMTAAVAPAIAHYLAGPGLTATRPTPAGDAPTAEPSLLVLRSAWSAAAVQIAVDMPAQDAGPWALSAPPPYRTGTGYTFTWREFQRRMQHGKIEHRDSFRKAVGRPPATLQQSYDAARQRTVWLGWSHAASKRTSESHPTVPALDSSPPSRPLPLLDLRQLPAPAEVTVQTVLSRPWIGTLIERGSSAAAVGPTPPIVSDTPRP